MSLISNMFLSFFALVSAVHYYKIPRTSYELLIDYKINSQPGLKHTAPELK
jgi:hypothetical protein